MKSLLLIACSHRKILTDDFIPAIERYDGGAYRVIRKLQRECSFPRNVEMLIISARFGLIDSHIPIPYYDQRMTVERAKELRARVLTGLEKRLSNGGFTQMYIDLGKSYLAAIEGLTAPRDAELFFASGRIGERLRSLKVWLTEKS